MAILKNIIVGLLAWTFGFGGVAGYIFLKERIPQTEPAPVHAAAPESKSDAAVLPQPAESADSMTVASQPHVTAASPDQAAAMHGDPQAAKRVLEEAARKYSEEHGATTQRPVATTPASRPADTTPVRKVNTTPRATRSTTRGYTVYASGAVEIPLANAPKALDEIPTWRVEQGLYSADELSRWEKNGQVRFVPNRASVEVLERKGELARVAVKSGSRTVSGWIYSRYIQSPGHNS